MLNYHFIFQIIIILTILLILSLTDDKKYIVYILLVVLLLNNIYLIFNKHKIKGKGEYYSLTENELCITNLKNTKDELNRIKNELNDPALIDKEEKKNELKKKYEDLKFYHNKCGTMLSKFKNIVKKAKEALVYGEFKDPGLTYGQF